jgi:hypothetical protein
MIVMIPVWIAFLGRWEMVPDQIVRRGEIEIAKPRGSVRFSGNGLPGPNDKPFEVERCVINLWDDGTYVAERLKNGN